MSPRSSRRSTWQRARMSRVVRRRLMRVFGVMAVATVLLAGGAVAPVVSTASATVPGTPGVTQPGTPVYTEDFSNQSAAAGAIDIRAYTGGAAAANSTYTADTQWTPSANQCNGWIMSWTTPSAPSSDLGCTNNASTTWPSLRSMARDLGLAQGQTATQANVNQVLTEYTNSTSGAIAAGTHFRTVNTIPAIAEHYYAVSAWFAAVNCPAAGGANQPKETFSLIVNGSPIVLSTGLNPCTNPTNWATQVTKLQSAAYMVPVGTTANLGLSLYNATASGSGNDVAFDLPQIVDVTPQLDKAFSPTVILNNTSPLANNTDGTAANNSYSTMTLTVTNTSDLMAKTDWRITDVLPTNLRIAPTPAIGGTCVQRAGGMYTVTAPAGGTTVTVTGGDLALNQASCTITVNVTSAVDGVYVNGPANITTNLNPPANASLEVISPSIDIVKTADLTEIYEVGDVVTYTFVVRNTTPKAPTNTVAGTTLTNVTITEDTFSGTGNMSPLSCTPTQPASLVSGASMTCTATYVVTQDDLDSGLLTNTARATGTSATTTPVTDTDPAEVPATWAPALVLEKSAAVEDVDGDGVTGLDDHIQYSFEVTNTGNVTVDNVAITDDLLSQFNITVTCAPTSIAPGEIALCEADAPYVVTQDDVDALEVHNTAFSTGTDPGAGPVTSNTDDTVTPIELFRIPLRVEKIGEDVNGDWVRMDGSTFTILEDVNGQPGLSVALVWVEVETGLFQIDSIPAGTYWLSELTAPDGFSLLAQPVQFTINPDRTITITGNGGGAVTAAVS